RSLCVLSVLYLLMFFFFSLFGPPRDLHSFPTRRSSDLAYYGIFVVEPGTLEMHKLEGADFRPMEPNASGRYPIAELGVELGVWLDRKSTRLNSSHVKISYAVFCLKKKKKKTKYA